MIICDLAETYHIYEYKELPPLKVAFFVMGLRSDSRLMMKLLDHKLTTQEQLLAGIFDRLSILVWAKTKDGQKNRNKPKLILDSFSKKTEEIKGFSTSKEFLDARNKILQSVERRE